MRKCRRRFPGVGRLKCVSRTAGDRAAEYDPFGEPIVAPFGTAYGFTGELTDGNGLLYLRARYLAPGLGMASGKDVNPRYPRS